VSLCDEFRRSMMSEFNMSDLGKMQYFLDIEVMQNLGGIFICQRNYAQEALSRFDMENFVRPKKIK